MKLCERLLFVLLMVSCVASWVAQGKVAVLAFGICWFIGAALAAVKGFHAIIAGKLTIIPGWDEFSHEKPVQIDCKKEPIRFWFHVSLVFLLAAVATAYGIYAWPVV